MTIKEYFAVRLYSKTDAQIIGEQLTQLARELKTTPDDIVVAATPKSAPLHDFFEWNDTKAAYAYRHEQARDMANSIHVVYVDPDGVERSHRAFHAVTVTNLGNTNEKGAKAYLTVEQVRESHDYRAQVVGDAKKQLTSWRQKYAEYEEIFAPVFAAVDEWQQMEEAYIPLVVA